MVEVEGLITNRFNRSA